MVAAPARLESVSVLAATAFVDVDQALDAVLNLTQRLLGMGTVYVASADQAEGVQKIVAVRDGEVGCGLAPGMEIPLQQTVCQRVVGSVTPLAIADLCTDTEAAQLPAVIELGLRGYVSVPILRTDGSAWGTLCGVDLDVRPVTDNELCWLRILAGLVGFQIERDRLEARLSRQALYDPLTSLANRAFLMDRLAVLEARATSPAPLFALLFVDLDDFKRINDTLGHEAGDQVLVAAAERLRSSVRGDDFVARLGGDEFVVLVEHLHRRELAVVLAERILAALSQPYRIGDREVMSTPSVGVAVSDAALDETGVEALLRAADVAMYRAKAAGKGSYVVFDPNMMARQAH